MNSMRCLRAKHRRPYPIYNRPMRISNMSPRTLSTLALAAFSAAALSAATDPFGGTWRLNPAKSKFSGEQIKIDDLGQNCYKIIGGGRFGHHYGGRYRSASPLRTHRGHHQTGSECLEDCREKRRQGSEHGHMDALRRRTDLDR